jgi:esterase
MRLAVMRVGTGPRPIILLHGFLGSGRNLATLARSWSQADSTRSFVLMDLTGHGTSPALPPNATLETIARDVLETAEVESVPGPLTIIGHSLGGRVALQALLLDAQRIRHIGLLDIGPGPIGESGDEQSRTMRGLAEVPAVFAQRDEARAALLAAGVAPVLIEWLLTNLVSGPDGYRWRISREALQALRPRISAANLWPAVEKFGARIHCIRGDRSLYVSDEDMARMQHFGSRVDTLREAGHFVHVDQPRKLLELLMSGTPV